MKIVLKGFLSVMPNAVDKQKPHFSFHTYEMTDYGYITVMPLTIEAELPAGFNMVSAQVAALKQQQDKARNDFHKRMAELNEQIGKLQALEFVPAAPANTVQEGASA